MFFMVWVVLAGAVVVALGIFLSQGLGRRGPSEPAAQPQDPPRLPPGVVLRQRLAEGDITEQEYDERLRQWHERGDRA